ncbi:MAG TPA: lipase family protein [Nevskiaceae bacterium]|nr:lipase family protein [Nevskiaceae bacterium]
MGTIDYDASRTALYQGGAHPTVFLPTGPTPSLDALCAECARLAYRRFELGAAESNRLVADLARVGLTDFEAFGSWSTGTRAFAVRLPGERRALIAFRGTEPDDVTDLGTDLEFSLTKWDGAARVHAGFLGAFESVADAISRWRDTHAPLPPVVTGHSLGAALATLAASRWHAARLVSFGSPRVGNPAFAATIPAPAQMRYVNCCDVVTELPPEIPDLYEHAGPMRYIDRLGRVEADWSIDKIASDRAKARAEYLGEYAWRFGNVLFRDLADHAPINYVRAFF